MGGRDKVVLYEYYFTSFILIGYRLVNGHKIIKWWSFFTNVRVVSVRIYPHMTFQGLVAHQPKGSGWPVTVRLLVRFLAEVCIPGDRRVSLVAYLVPTITAEVPLSKAPHCTALLHYCRWPLTSLKIFMCVGGYKCVYLEGIRRKTNSNHLICLSQVCYYIYNSQHLDTY